MLQTPHSGPLAHTKPKNKIPDSWRGGVDPAADKITVTTDPMTQTAKDPKGVAQACEAVMVDAGLDPKAWMIQENQITWKRWLGLKTSETGEVVETPLYSIKAVFIPRPAEARDIDELVKLVQKAKPVKVKGGSSETFVIGLADMQLFKLESDPERVIQRTITVVNRALDMIDGLKTSPRPAIHIAWEGDEGEYHTSQGGRNSWRTTATPTETSRVIRRVMLRVLDMVVDYGASKVTVSAVPSNHGEVTRHQSMRMDDDYSVDALVAVTDAIQLNPDRYGHVTTYVPKPDTDYVTLTLSGVTLGMVHGHKIPGYPQPKQVFNWLAGQHLGENPVGAADVLLTGHGHHLQMAERSKRLWVMAPSLEDYSAWWRARSGDVGNPGGVLMHFAKGQVKIVTKVSE